MWLRTSRQLWRTSSTERRGSGTALLFNERHAITFQVFDKIGNHESRSCNGYFTWDCLFKHQRLLVISDQRLEPLQSTGAMERFDVN